jgi:hypothetical protein
MKMRRTILTFVALVLCLGARGDERSQALLGTLAEKVASWGDYRVEFSVSVEGESLAGSYEVSGESYHIATPDIEIFSDGRTKWEVSLLDGEVAIDRVDPTDHTVMSNPTRLFDFLDGDYTHRYIGPALVNSAKCDLIELTRSEGAPDDGMARQIDVFLSTETGLPVRVGYAIGFMSAEATVDVVRITPRVALGADFRYNPARWAGYEVIDFR